MRNLNKVILIITVNYGIDTIENNFNDQSVSVLSSIRYELQHIIK